MIISAFLLIINYFIQLIVSVFPVGNGYPQQVHEAASTLGGYVGILNPIFPIDTLYQILLIVISIEIAILGFKSFKWLMSHLPFVGGRG